jgi:hypothetical protein
MAKDFYMQMFHISHIPFLHFVEGKGEPEKLKAVLFYVHHDQLIDEINPKLEAGGCRPITANELNDLFRMQEGVLEQMKFDSILATDPHSIENEPGGGKILTAIWCGEDGSLGIRRIRIRHATLWNHSGIYVAAVKKE